MPSDWSQQLHNLTSRRADRSEPCHTVRKPGRIPSLSLPERATEILSTKGIQVEAYSPLARGERLKHPRISSLAEKYAKTPAQLMIRWGIQQGLVVIPKSTREERIRENSQVFDFDISDDDMRSLDPLNEALRLNWDPTNVP